MNLMVRTTIACAVATGLALFIFTPSVARANNNAGSPTAVAAVTSEQSDTELGHSGDQANTQLEQTGDQGEMLLEQSGNDGNKDS